MLNIKSLESIKTVAKVNGQYILTEIHKEGIPNTNIKLPKSGIIEIELQGVKMEVTAEWLYCYTRLNIRFCNGYENDMKQLILFMPNTDTDSFPRAYFKRPIEIYITTYALEELTFRVIPYAPNYAITKDGWFFNIKRGDVFRQDAFIVKDDNDTRPNKRIKISLNGVSYYLDFIIASTWRDNPDKSKLIYVKHLDGLLYNNKVENLEWVAEKPRYKKAKQKRDKLKELNIPCALKNLNTNEVKEFPSIWEAMRSLNRAAPATTFVNLRNDRPYIIKVDNFYYQLQFLADKLEWVTLDEAMDSYKRIRRVRYTLTIENLETRQIYTYNNLKDISEFMNNGKKYVSLNEAIADLRKRKEYKVTKRLVHNCNKIDYIAVQLSTGGVLYSSTTTSLIQICNVPKACIRKSAINNGRYIYNGWVFKEDNGEEFEKPEEIVNKPKEIVLKNDSKEMRFKSLRAAGRYLKTSHHVVHSALKGGYPINGYQVIED